MGQLQSLRRCSGSGGLPVGDVDLVMLDAAAHQHQQQAAADPREQELRAALATLREESRACLAGVRRYQDQAAVLRSAMASPQDEALQLRAFRSLLPNAAIVKAAYDLSTKLGETLPALFKFLAGPPLREHQVLLRQLADLLDLALLWDYEKMRRPALQNDFSYYRRYHGKVAPRLTRAEQGSLPVSEAEAGLVSMFIAQPLPLTVAVEGAIKALGGKGGAAMGMAPAAGVERESLGAFCAAVDTVGTLANVACDLALRPGLSDETRRYALRVMTAAVVLYDRVSAAGVFTRRSPVRTKKCLRTLRRAQQEEEGLGPAEEDGSVLAQQLLNSVKYSTVHFKDGSTPGYIRSLLSD